MTRRALALAALAACSDPGDVCPDLSTASAQARCGTRVITIDGDLHDWDAIPASSYPCTECTPGQVLGLHTVRTTDDQLAIYVETIGDPFLDANRSYWIILYALRRPQYELDLRIQSGMAPEMELDGLGITGLPASVAFGSTGIELAMPMAALPFDGGVIASGEVDSRRPFGAWNLEQNVVPYAYVCWNPASPACQR